MWTVPTLLSTFETVMFARLANRPMPVWRAFVAEAPQWYGLAVLSPVIVAMGRQFPLRRPIRVSHLLAHAVVSVLVSALVAMADASVNALVRPSPLGLFASARSWFLAGLPATTLAYFAIIGVSYALSSTARLRERERQSAELETQLREAQLSALRMQLQPHFLFNSLNAIMALVRDKDTDRAVRALSLLSDVLRVTVNAGAAHETTLSQELEFLTRYLEIERMRFGDRLRITLDVPRDLHDALVPTFVLQPFVENSLKHGVLRDRTGNEITVRARVAADALTLTVTDDGRGLPANGAPTAGVGISNVRARLERMYGGAAQLSVRNAEVASGAVVEISLPFRTLAGAPA
jgi:two-component sensor histidine kinase/membrane protein implicated in regulation of membrane protease activity